MERLTKREISGITYNNSPGFMCSCYCDNCSKGTGDCDRLKAMVNRLAKFEDLEEQGLLVRLPCKVGDTVWDIDTGRPEPYKITAFSYGCHDLLEFGCADEITFYYTGCNKPIAGAFLLSEIGKTVFLTREEAEEGWR